jgi:type I restriction enzyme, S subunit
MRKYDSYKDSGIEWIGEIPKHWSVSRLKFNSKIKTGYTPPMDNSENYSDDGMIWVKPDNLEYFKPILDSKEKISPLGIKEQNIIAKDSVLLCCIGSIGKFGIAGLDLLTNQQICGITFNNSLLPSYGKYLVYVSEEELNKYANGNVVRILNATSLGNIEYPIPVIEEQTAIANYLDQKTNQIDDLIAKKERLIQLLEEERTAIINQAVTKGLDPSVPIKDSGIDWLGEIPEHWEVKKLKYLFDNLNSIRIPLSSEERGRMESRFYDYYGASGVIDQVENYLFDGENILIGEDGANLLTRSKRLAFIASGKYWVNNHAHIIKPKTGNINYFCELLELIDYSIWVTGSAQPKLTQEALMNIQLIEPPIGEQNQIAKHLDEKLSQINLVKENYQQEIELLKEYKTALISEVVTGKVDVRNT